MSLQFEPALPHTSKPRRPENALLELLEREPGAWRGGDVEPALWQRALLHPAQDFLGHDGKGFRGELVRGCHRLAGGLPGKMPDTLPLIIELLHAGSLIVDDIEDGATTRRGAPALHVAHGLPRALNTGNWMYFWALDLVPRVGLPEDAQLEIYRHASQTLMRCHEGQALDISCGVHELDQSSVPPVVRATTTLKTGALMAFAARLGAVAAGATKARCEKLARFGERLGIGLQMLDDWGSLRSPARLHKGLEDLRQRRPTWPWAWLAQRRSRRAFAALQRSLCDGQHLEGIAVQIVSELQDHAGKQIRVHLDEALAALRADVGPSPVLDAFAQRVDILEKSYG